MKLNLTVEEMNMIAMYAGSDRKTVIRNITAAKSYMNTEGLKLAEQTLNLLRSMTDETFAALEMYPVYEEES